MQIAIDTSTQISSLALAEKGQVIAELTWHCRQNHTVELAPSLIYLLRQAKAGLDKVDGVIVAKGPGSYNGLRAGMSVAKGLAFSLNIPLVGISTLEVEAYPYSLTALPLCPIHDAGRGEIATALYQWREGRWTRLMEERITTLDDLCSGIKARTLFCGELNPMLHAEIEERLGELAIIPQVVTRLRRAGYLAELGWQRIEKGDFDDVATLQPLYLRKPPITQPKSERR